MKPRTAGSASRRPRVRRRRLAVLALVLTIAALVMPGASIRTGVMLVKVDSAQGIDGPDDVIWILALGSDARQGQPVLEGSRADAIQMIGVNLRTGVGSVIGIPRGSLGAPSPASAPTDRLGHVLRRPAAHGGHRGGAGGRRPGLRVHDHVVGFKAMISALGGVTVDSDMAFTDDNMVGDIQEGVNRLDGVEALFFGRARHFLPNGDSTGRRTSRSCSGASCGRSA